MSEDVRHSLARLHDKQDEQTAKLTSLEVTVAKQDASIESYVRQTDKMSQELSRLNDNMSVYNTQLQLHIAGVLELKEQNRLMREEIKQRDVLINSRLEIAEKPIEWATFTFKVIKWSAAVIGGLATALGLALKFLGKI
jgi:chromosome segregation ATPase